MDCLKNKRILITGSCGAVGSELIKQLLSDTSVELVCIDNNEAALFHQEKEYKDEKRIRFFLSDVQNRDQLIYRCQGIDLMFHTAAFKLVDLCERSPLEAVKNNILAIENIIYAAKENHLEKVIFTSSDKAVHPTSVMGATKLIGEHLITEANQGEGPIFSSIRFGNMLAAGPSVITIFQEQIKQGRPLTLTDKRMTRYIMRIEEATHLMIKAVSLIKGGEVFIMKMPVIRIEDLAKVMIEELAPEFGYHPDEMKIIVTGSRKGEKLYEELMSEEEMQRAIELQRYFIIMPTSVENEVAYDYQDAVSFNITQSYNSSRQKPLSKSEIKSWLISDKLLPERTAEAIRK